MINETKDGNLGGSLFSQTISVFREHKIPFGEIPLPTFLHQL
jgi:hypothetical protein